MKKLLIVAFVAIAAIVGVLAINPEDSSAIKIGTVFPDSGDERSLGENETNGADLAIKEINNRGGVLGKTLELTDSTSPDFVLVHWPGSSAGGKANDLIKVLDAKKKIAIVIAGGEIDLPKISPFLFRVAPSDALAVHTFVDYLDKDKKYRNIAIVRTKGDWEDSVVTAFNKYSSTTPFKITQFDIGDDIQESVPNLKALNADAVFIAIESDEILAKFVETERNSGVKGEFIYPRDLTYAKFSGKVSPANLKNFIYPIFQPPNYLFVGTYTTEYGTQPGLYADTSYDAVNMIANAIAAASSTDPEAVKESFMPLNGASGRVVFNEDGERSEVNIGFRTFDLSAEAPK